jgi:2-oxoglutarate dehydrogenase E1 component
MFSVGLPQEEVDGIHSKITQILNEEFEASKSYVPKKKDWLASHWEGFMSPAQLSRIRNTGEHPGNYPTIGCC